MFFSFQEHINSRTRMSIDGEDIFIEQDYGDDKVRTLRLTQKNVIELLNAWEGLMCDVNEAKMDVMVETDISIGDRIRISVNTDFPFLNFRRWRAVSWKGESLPGEHGFTLHEDDFKAFEGNIKIFNALHQ